MGVHTDTQTQSMYQGIQAVVPEIRIVLQFRERRDEALQLKGGGETASSLIYRFTASVEELKQDQ